MKAEFRLRRPERHADYLAGTTPEPVSVRLYRYYIKQQARLEDLARNLRLHSDTRDKSGSLHAVGPGEVYEIDSTKGRIHLLSSIAQYHELGTPAIYLLIDRWSRFEAPTSSARRWSTPLSRNSGWT